MKSLAIIPARFASTRFPGKLLTLLAGKPLLKWVWESVCKSNELDNTIIATDHKIIYQAAKSWGANVEMTLITHQSGTDRCAEVAERNKNFDVIVNIQGDEPFIEPGNIDLLIHHLKQNREIPIATLCCRIAHLEDLNNPNVVKVVKTANRAQYFSRSPIPFFRNNNDKIDFIKNPYYQHIGIYGFQLNALLDISQLPESQWEKIEKLEQLRWLENRYPIDVLEIAEKTIGIDTPEDLKEAEAFILKVKPKK